MENQILYEMLIDDEYIHGVYAISLVESPAIKTDYILLSNNKNNKINIDVKLDKLIDKKRKIVCGAVLIPELIIPRDGYDIKFSSDTIRKISENFLMNGYKDNVTLQHQQTVNKINLVESWLVEDPNNDKTNALGLNVPKGTWCASFKINDENLWNEYIVSGVLKGFSIEGSFSQKEVNLSNEKIDDDVDKDIEFIIHKILNNK